MCLLRMGFGLVDWFVLWLIGFDSVVQLSPPHFFENSFCAFKSDFLGALLDVAYSQAV
jgi:hypothetical protein